MISINVPDAAYSENRMSFGGQFYTVIFRYNTRDERWRMDIYTQDRVVILGVKIMENQALLGKYILPEFSHGDIYCVRLKNDNLPVGRDNLGINLAYELIYMSNAEIGDL